jgi:hypothetical protein
MALILLLMITAGLPAVITSFLFQIKPSGFQIFWGYAIYFVLAGGLVILNRGKQLYFSTIDIIALAFIGLVAIGLTFGGIDRVDTPRNAFYFVLFVCMPVIVGRTFSLEGIARFETFLLGLLVLIPVLILLKGGIYWPEEAVRPVLFSSEYSTLPLSFALGVGVLISIWRGCIMENRAVVLAHGALLVLFIVSSAYIVLRGSYYLTILCAVGLLLVARKQKGAPIMSVALTLGVMLGIGISYGSVSYHEKLLHPALSQLSLEALYLDFFSTDGRLEPGRPILGYASCFPITESNDSTMIRILLYLEAVKLFLNAPLLGTGVSSFSQFSCLSTYGYPHSTVLHVAAEMGLAGLVLFISMVWKSCNVIARAASSAKLPYWVFFVFIYYFCIDQIYGNYFSASMTYFMVGLASKISADEGLTSTRK